MNSSLNINGIFFSSIKAIHVTNNKSAAEINVYALLFDGKNFIGVENKCGGAD